MEDAFIKRKYLDFWEIREAVWRGGLEKLFRYLT